MVASILFACALIANDPANQPTPTVADREAYEAARVKAGRLPEANIKLALWCEAHGLEVERLKHLSLAALADPTNVTARALMGIVSEGGRWGRPEAVAARIKANAELTALRAQYETLRNQTEPKADDHWKLARWCEQNGLLAEARAHDTAVTRLDPSREAAWKKLGCIKFEGRWLTPAQIETVKADREAQAQADRKWRPIVEKWKVWLGKPQRQAELESAMLEVTDPRAVPSIWKVFVTTSTRDQSIAVRLFAQIDSTEASRRLAVIAVYGATEEVRRSAIETLRMRDVRGVLDPVIRLLRDPIKFVAKPNQGLESPGVIHIEGQEANYERVYPAQMIFNLKSPNVQRRLPQILDEATELANERFFDDVRSLQLTNLSIEATNKNALTALRGITGKDFGLNREGWLGWWTDRQGYAFKPTQLAQTQPKATFTEYLDPYRAPSHSCFAAGTPVQTLDGARPIEELKIGDRVLTQDTTTGSLTYQPILSVFHNPPADTLRVRVAGETIVTTAIHRFWKAGQGWAMARELKSGDTVRILGGTARIESVEPDKRQAVFNLEVAQGTSFFVGTKGTLVHDNSLVLNVEKPFDATPDLASPGK